ncbi:outer membrane beta-barrel protein [Catenovulum sp. 2E275]|uniref:outer membrane beta-barrel protein n=1 Tax=Catenovulum sp. 2E275 TaxID=2980497 RepID=UPI0021CE8AEA|nr:outer membrane beta-barrel protein [Catenovulum sp. 2E275]MCU4674130.1 outer membrane beta-barrel protein [Catenovulum sp. 2E275]
MKKCLISAVLLAASGNVLAQDNFYIELLAGQAFHKIESSIQGDTLTKSDHYSNSETTSAPGLKLGYYFNDTFAVELSHQDYGTPIKEQTFSTSSTSENANGETEEFTTLQTYKRPISVKAYKLGIKAEREFLSDLYLNLGFGVAMWQYDDYTPQSLTNEDVFTTGESGQDMYYSLGARYQINQTFYVGVQYSMLEIEQTTKFKPQYSTILGSYKHQIQDVSFILGLNF